MYCTNGPHIVVRDCRDGLAWSLWVAPAGLVAVSSPAVTGVIVQSDVCPDGGQTCWLCNVDCCVFIR